jgi:YggT family protein
LLARDERLSLPRVTTILAVVDGAVHVLRIALAVVGGGLLVVATVDWAVRTRRINPFSPISRFFRRAVDPLLAPVEARVVRAGGLPSQAPWWTLAAVVVAGVLLIVLLQWLHTTVVSVALATESGGPGILRLVIGWLFELLKLALIIRVLVSWIGMRYAWWARASFRLTDWIVRPIARVMPPFGMIDFSPLVAYFVIYLVQVAVLGSLFA